MDESAVGVYETFVRDMLQVFLSRYEELKDAKDLSDFDKGRRLAYWEKRHCGMHTVFLKMLDSISNKEYNTTR